MDDAPHPGGVSEPRPKEGRLRSIAERDSRADLGVLGDPALAVKVVDRIDGAIDIVRKRVVRPIERAATAVALGLLAVIAGSAALILILIGVFRLASELFSPYEWIAHAILGVLLVTVGIFVFWKKAFREN